MEWKFEDEDEDSGINPDDLEIQPIGERNHPFIGTCLGEVDPDTDTAPVQAGVGVYIDAEGRICCQSNDFGLGVSAVADPTDPVARIRTESNSQNESINEDEEFAALFDDENADEDSESLSVSSSFQGEYGVDPTFPLSPSPTESMRRSDNRRYLLICAGCRYAREFDTGPFMLGTEGIVCARCGCSVDVSQLA